MVVHANAGASLCGTLAVCCNQLRNFGNGMPSFQWSKCTHKSKNYRRFRSCIESTSSQALPCRPKPSALHGSIETKKDISYYYAHAPREQAGEAPAPMPVHRPIATTSYVPGEQVKEIKSFQFLDDGKFVKVYLPLGKRDRITAANVTADFQTRSLCVTICDLEQLPLQFRIARLQNDIMPTECVVKVLKTKVMLKLKKAAVVEKASDDAELPDGADAEAAAPDIEKEEPIEGDDEDSAFAHMQDAADNGSVGQDAEYAQPAISEVKEHYPHWHQLRG